MPTGYTSEIYNEKEVSGKEFLMKCARAFGACIEMKDTNLDEPIPKEFKPDTYHKEQIEKTKIKLKELQNISNDEIENIIETEYNKTLESNKQKIEEYKELKSRYLKTLSEVELWQPPTLEHVNLKEFAIEQIKTSIDWDCNISYFENMEVKKLTAEEWLKNQINKYEEDIKYHTKKYKEEVKRVEERNKWIKDLRESLK